MRFREFLEALDIMGADTAGYDFHRRYPDEEGDQEYQYTFNIGGRNFTVIIFPVNGVEVHSSGAPETISMMGAYSVEFKGSLGYSSTGQMGPKAFAVYREVMISIRAFMQKHEVNAIKFSEYEPKMKQVYDLFYRNFLLPDPPKGAGFIRVGSGSYVSKDYLRKNPEEFPRDILSSILKADRSERSVISKIKQREAEKKKATAIIKSLYGKFVRIKGGQIGGKSVIAAVSEETVYPMTLARLINLSSSNFLEITRIPVNDPQTYLMMLDLSKPPTKAEIDDFMERAASNPVNMTDDRFGSLPASAQTNQSS